MFVIQTRNYVLKLVNSSVRASVLFSILPKWHVIKTKHTCRFGESGIGRTSGGWKFPEPMRGGFGKLPATRGHG